MLDDFTEKLLHNQKGITLIDLERGINRFTINCDSLINDCKISPNGRLLIAACGQYPARDMNEWFGENVVKVWDTLLGIEIHNFRGHTDRVTTCSFDPMGELIISGSADKSLKVWDIKDRILTMSLYGHENSISCCDVSSDGSWIVSGSEDGELIIWDFQKGVDHIHLNCADESVRSCAISPNSHWLLSVSGESFGIMGGMGAGNNSLQVWELISGKLVTTFNFDGIIRACAWYPNGNLIIAGGDGGLYTLRVNGLDEP